MRHAPREHLARHPHPAAFAAVLLSGSYVEAGDTGRHWVTPGDVVLHQAWESHLDRFDARGAQVLVLAVDDRDAARICGRIADPDALVRTAERDPAAASRQLMAQLAPKTTAAADWPDLLAAALSADPGLSLGDWARAYGLHLGSVSRGFRQVFGLTPIGFRLVQKTRRALAAVKGSAQPLSHVALECGFADQAHMARAIRGMARTTPGTLRRATPV